MYNHGRKLNGFVFNERVEDIMANEITKNSIMLEYIRRHEVRLE